MTRNRLLRTLLLVLLAALPIGMAVRRSIGQPRGFTPPAPAAPKAPLWTREQPTPLEQLPGQPIEEAPANLRAKYGWPADFKLPLDIVIDDVPEVPERIKGPSPPLDEAQHKGVRGPLK